MGWGELWGGSRGIGGGRGVFGGVRVPAPTRRPAGNYRTQLWDKQSEAFLPSTPGLGMHVEVKDPDGKVGNTVGGLWGSRGGR